VVHSPFRSSDFSGVDHPDHVATLLEQVVDQAGSPPGTISGHRVGHKEIKLGGISKIYVIVILTTMRPHSLAFNFYAASEQQTEHINYPRKLLFCILAEHSVMNRATKSLVFLVSWKMVFAFSLTTANRSQVFY
jgi:hypothetical protein